jgi:hypothetical protein
MFDQNLIVGLVVLAVVVMAVYAYAPKVRAMLSGFGAEGFADAKNGVKKSSIKTPAANPSMGGSKDAEKGKVAKAAPKAAPAPAGKAAEGFSDYQSGAGSDGLAPIPMAGADKPAGCYPREQINPSDLMPLSDPNSQWAQANPSGSGDLQGKNFLSAGALVGVNTIGQSLRNANYQLRADPPCPQGQWPIMQSTIEPDLQRRTLE